MQQNQQMVQQLSLGFSYQWFINNKGFLLSPQNGSELHIKTLLLKLILE